ncbi:MAG: retroviral-like aspartic protease family protein [Gemmataceae bacterium]|nr:retroviral-like aspartic protease family protein [Gemmataceae bacterium]
MSHPFLRTPAGLIVVQGVVTGPAQTVSVRFLIDTGSSTTALAPAFLARAGVDLHDPLHARPVQVITGNGVVAASSVVLTRPTSMGRTRIGIRVNALPLPAAAGVDGLLGMDFLDGNGLAFDFAARTVALA